ncbi:MAG: hypothetical protein EBZ87_02520, partial [Microbacteriaceae bacterium]|nr:hypothetical protein [Microbacteriaceae bacterium]
AAGQTGRLFVSTDTFEIYRDNGTTWDLIGGPGSSTITGTGTATQVAYFTSSQAIGSSANLFWDNTNGYLGVGTATPGARIEAVKTDGYGIYANYTTNAGSGASTTAIYAINNTASSGYAAVIEEKTGNTTGGQYPLLVKHSLSSGTAAVGNGTGLQFQLQDDAGTFKTTQLTIETIDAAAATYATRYRFNVQSAGSSTPAAYLNATGLGLGTATPGAKLDIHSTGTLAQFNSTGTTNNAYLAIQRAGTTTFSIGDTYNAGLNYFRIFSNSLSADVAQIFEATGKTVWQASQTYSTGLARGNYFDYNLSVPAGTSFTSPNSITALGASLDLTLAGNATIPSGARTGLDAYNSVNFTSTGTLTMTQGTQIRPYSNITSGWAFAGSATGTITHLAGLRVLFPDNTGSAVTVTNNYGVLINDQTANTGTVTYSSRWGIYQEGTSDLNYLAANLLIGSTTNSGEALQVTGTAKVTSTLTANSLVKNGGTASQILAADGSVITAGTNITISAGTISASGGLTGSGTTNYLPKFTASTTVGDSRFLDDGTQTFLGNGSTNASPSTGIFSATGGSGTNIAGAELRIRGGASTGNAAGGPITFYTSAAGASGSAANAATEKMRIDANGLLLVGTTDTTNTDKVRVNNDGTSVYSTIRISNANSTANMYIGVGGSAVANTALRNNAYVWNSAATALLLGTSDAESMRITSGGATANVGIGTTTIGSKLQVNGNAAIGYSASTAAPTNGLQVAGNITINQTIASWGSNFRVVQIGARSAFVNSDINYTHLSNNLYYDGSFYRYLTTAAVSQILQGAGEIAFQAAISGTAGNNFTLSDIVRMRLNVLELIDSTNIVVATTTGTKIGTATSQKLAFWNATPIVQPTTAVAGAARVAGGGATVTDTDTFGGYTIAQVVQALRNTGILA